MFSVAACKTCINMAPRLTSRNSHLILFGSSWNILDMRVWVDDGIPQSKRFGWFGRLGWLECIHSNNQNNKKIATPSYHLHRSDLQHIPNCSGTGQMTVQPVVSRNHLASLPRLQLCQGTICIPWPMQRPRELNSWLHKKPPMEWNWVVTPQLGYLCG